jgi:isopenicillin N synthase-like dioxygenase
MPRNDDQQMSDLDWFSSRHRKPSACTLRLLHYPALPSDTVLEDEIDIRAGAHSDYGSITLLFQRPSQPGLEILTPESTWAPVPVIPEGYQTTTPFPPILVNIADLLSYWTNGYLKSTVHRVIFPKDARRGGEDRYSIAYFCHPSDDAELVPVPSQIVAERTIAEGEKVGYGGGTEGKKAMTAQEHLARRLGATYGFRMDEKAQVIDATA